MSRTLFDLFIFWFIFLKIVFYLFCYQTQSEIFTKLKTIWNAQALDRCVGKIKYQQKQDKTKTQESLDPPHVSALSNLTDLKSLCTSCFSPPPHPSTVHSLRVDHRGVNNSEVRQLMATLELSLYNPKDIIHSHSVCTLFTGQILCFSWITQPRTSSTAQVGAFAKLQWWRVEA